jgi:AcrR family transcriptional regulator
VTDSTDDGRRPELLSDVSERGRALIDPAAADPVLEHLLRTAIELLDEEGPEAVTLRAVAQRSHYEPSTVSYHISTIDEFRRELWTRIGAVLAADLIELDGRAEVWPNLALTYIEQWNRLHPNRARFYALGSNTAAQWFNVDFSHEFERRWGVTAAYLGHGVVAVYFARKLQFIVEMVLRAAPEGTVEGWFRPVLLNELADSRAAWTQVTR